MDGPTKLTGVAFNPVLASSISVVSGANVVQSMQSLLIERCALHPREIGGKTSLFFDTLVIVLVRISVNPVAVLC